MRWQPPVWLLDDWGRRYCVGEIINHSSEPVNGVSIAVTVDDADGELVTVDEGYTGLYIIPARGASPFKVTFWDDIPEDGDYVATVTGDFAHEYALEDWYTALEIVEHTLDYTDDGQVVVSGRVENVGDATAESIKVVVTGYDVEEDVVVAESGYLEIDTLEPGDSAPFLVAPYSPVPVTDYVLQVEASRGLSAARPMLQGTGCSPPTVSSLCVDGSPVRGAAARVACPRPAACAPRALGS